MEQETPFRTSIDSVASMLSNYSDEGSKDRNVTYRLLRDARGLVERYGKGYVKGHKLVTDRLLFSLMDYAVDEGGQRYVANAIMASKDQPDPKDFLETLAQVWLTQLLYPVKAKGLKREGVPSEDQTPTYQHTASLIENASRGDQKALRSLLHRRQGQKCAVSGFYSDEAPHEIVQNAVVVPAIASHILPFSLNEFQDTKTSSIKTAAITWDMIAAWGSFDILKLVGSEINGPANAILLRGELDLQFGKFQFWFEPTAQLNTYNLVALPNRNTGYNNTVVTFVNCCDTPIAFPDPKILALHAAFAQVLHASGAGAYIDSCWRDMDTIRVLSTDGATSLQFLNIALQRLVSVYV